MSNTAPDAQMPAAWRDLLEGIGILARHPANAVSPFHCEHDELIVCADPAEFTAEEIDRLDVLGFTAHDDYGLFRSFRFGSA